jgi:hypothetical protein
MPRRFHYGQAFMILLITPPASSTSLPLIGAGIGIMGKADINSSLDKTHYSHTYGYHAKGGLHFNVNQNLMLTLELTYNLMMPPAPEELDIAGLITTVGVLLPVGRKK